MKSWNTFGLIETSKVILNTNNQLISYINNGKHLRDLTYLHRGKQIFLTAQCMHYRHEQK